MSQNKVYRDTCQIGAFIPPTPENDYAARLDAFEDMIGRKLAQVLVFHGWSDGIHQNFPLEQFNKILQNGSVPHMVWEPSYDGQDESALITETIINGKLDDYIWAFAQEAKKFGKPFFLRPAHEMNGHWYGWSGLKNGEANGGPQRYIDMYRHIYSIFQEEQVTNVSWVWAPFATSFPDEAWNKLSRYWPGNDCVDWIGLDGYNWYEYYPYKSFDDLFHNALGEVLKVTDTKPIMLAEFGSNKFDGRDKWIDDVFSNLRTNDYYKCIDAFIWFNIDKAEDGKQLKWAVHPEDIKDAEAMRRSLNHDYFTELGDTRLQEPV